MGRIFVFFILYCCVFFARGEPQYIAENNDQTLSVFVVPYDLEKPGRLRYQDLYKTQPDKIILTNSHKPPTEGTGDIVKFLREQKGSVSLVCYHRAAAECLDSLLLYPELQDEVDRFISLEGKIKGEEKSEGIAKFQVQDIERAKKLPLGAGIRLILGKVKEWLFPYYEGVYAMNPQSRSRYLRRKRDEIRKLSSKVRLISIDTSSKKYGVIPNSHILELSQSEKKAFH